MQTGVPLGLSLNTLRDALDSPSFEITTTPATPTTPVTPLTPFHLPTPPLQSNALTAPTGASPAVPSAPKPATANPLEKASDVAATNASEKADGIFQHPAIREFLLADQRRLVLSKHLKTAVASKTHAMEKAARVLKESGVATLKLPTDTPDGAGAVIITEQRPPPHPQLTKSAKNLHDALTLTLVQRANLTPKAAHDMIQTAWDEWVNLHQQAVARAGGSAAAKPSRLRITRSHKRPRRNIEPNLTLDPAEQARKKPRLEFESLPHQPIKPPQPSIPQNERQTGSLLSPHSYRAACAEVGANIATTPVHAAQMSMPAPCSPLPRPRPNGTDNRGSPSVGRGAAGDVGQTAAVASPTVRNVSAAHHGPPSSPLRLPVVRSAGVTTPRAQYRGGGPLLPKLKRSGVPPSPHAPPLTHSPAGGPRSQVVPPAGTNGSARSPSASPLSPSTVSSTSTPTTPLSPAHGRNRTSPLLASSPTAAASEIGASALSMLR